MRCIRSPRFVQGGITSLHCVPGTLVESAASCDVPRTQNGLRLLSTALKDALSENEAVADQHFLDGAGPRLRETVSFLLAVAEGEKPTLLSEAVVAGERLVAPQVHRIACQDVSSLAGVLSVAGTDAGFSVTWEPSHSSSLRQ